MSVRAIIQARMSSNRLRGKTLMPVAGVPLLARVVSQVQSHPWIDGVTVATSTLQADDPIAAYCNYLGIGCVRGHQTNVLQRFQAVAETLEPQDTIVRVTADNCFTRRDLNSQIYRNHRDGNYDYSCVQGLSHVVYEFVQVDALNTLGTHAQELMPYDLEHVTPYLRDPRNQFRIRQYDPQSLGLRTGLDKLLTIDTQDDLVRVESILQEVEGFDTLADVSRLYSHLHEWSA